MALLLEKCIFYWKNNSSTAKITLRLENNSPTGKIILFTAERTTLCTTERRALVKL